MKTEYFPKHNMSIHDNKVTGPGWCIYLCHYIDTQRSTLTNNGSYSQQRKKIHSFGDTQRNKLPKPSQIGPGS